MTQPKTWATLGIVVSLIIATVVGASAVAFVGKMDIGSAAIPPNTTASLMNTTMWTCYSAFSLSLIIPITVFAVAGLVAALVYINSKSVKIKGERVE